MRRAIFHQQLSAGSCTAASGSPGRPLNRVRRLAPSKVNDTLASRNTIAAKMNSPPASRLYLRVPSPGYVGKILEKPSSGIHPPLSVVVCRIKPYKSAIERSSPPPPRGPSVYWVPRFSISIASRGGGGSPLLEPWESAQIKGLSGHGHQPKPVSASLTGLIS